MAEVIVYDQNKVLDLTNNAVIGASINDDGELILDRQGNTPINLGNIGKFNDVQTFQGGNPLDNLQVVTVEDDGTDTATWVNRFMGKFKAPLLASRAVIWFNEYFELRLAPAKHNTTAFVIYVRENADVQPTARNATIPLMVLRDDRDVRTHYWGLYDQGVVRVGPNALQDVPAIVLGPLDPIPAGTPNPCIIYRTT